jgi:hypothetical protein
MPTIGNSQSGALSIQGERKLFRVDCRTPSNFYTGSRRLADPTILVILYTQKTEVVSYGAKSLTCI